MSDIVKKQFDDVAPEYDRQRRQLIPCFDDFYGIAADLVNCSSDAPRILDLGAGTGLFSSFIRSKYPNASLTLIDLSEEMLKEAHSRFGQDPAVSYITADYTSYPYTEKYDAIISSLSIHHLTHPAKRALFQTIHGLLLDGGIFVNADQAAGTTVYWDDYYMSKWKEAIWQSGLDAKAIEASIERRKVDINATVQDQLDWLLEAGFEQNDCVYKNNLFAVFAALKS
ncbi:SAM-dependent methyltransferase [Paenibacillus sp. FSL H8-0548]|uniref:class I SAM-dependent methyltransferase n=1 Tax=Paenibacillus sp. FSL H8-0548 TaxID=1920422 RepID=UPI00096BE4AB|nr:class I SAM-dependent methyltransferase [Paenibacillus sp. FSL H8-0548]OMF37798.1 SAM-dependent methyltransferase [Paenibacillus sp. FSL H8-0548]